MIRRKGDRLGVKVSARTDACVLWKDEWMFGYGIRFAYERHGNRAHQLKASAHHLRLAAQRIWILDPIALQMRGTDPASGEQAPKRRSDVLLCRLTAQPVNARIKRRITALQRIDRQRAARERRSKYALNL